MFERLVLVQGRDGDLHHFAIPESVLPLEPANYATMLRLILPTVVEEINSMASTFFASSRDASNCVLSFMDADSWLELERCCRACRQAVAASRCWLTPVMEGHSLRFPPEERKAEYVRHRRAVCRVAKAFEDLRRFARSPASVFNPGASLADTFHAEQRTGVVFPEEARASFTVFDGQAHSAWLRAEGVIGGFELLSLEEAVEVMLEEACFRRALGTPPEFVPLANKRNSSEWLAAAIDGGRACVVKPLMRPKVVASSWSHYLRVQ